jgi:hypothetical protein
MTIPICELEAGLTHTLQGEAARGSESAIRELSDLFIDWEGPHQCFLCDKTFEHQPCVLIMTDPKDSKKCLGLGCCIDCHSLPIMYRFARARKIFKAWNPRYRLHLVPSKKLR